MSEPDEVQEDQTEEAPVEETKLDDGAASVFIGVSPEYQNFANETERPIVTAAEVQQFVDQGVLEVVKVGDDVLVSGNMGVVSGTENSNADLAPAAVAEEFEANEEKGGDDAEEKSPTDSSDETSVKSEADAPASGEAEATEKKESLGF